MMPTPAPGYLAPVVCAATIARVNASSIAGDPLALRKTASFSGVVVGPWAYFGFGLGDEGGQEMLHRVDGRWCRIASGGGAMNEAEVKAVAGPVYGERLWIKMGNK
jgi:hypothetical protein